MARVRFKEMQYHWSRFRVWNWQCLQKKESTTGEPQETPWSGIYITSERDGIQQGTALGLCWKYIWLRREEAPKSRKLYSQDQTISQRGEHTSNTQHTLLWQGSSSPQLRELITTLCLAASIRLSRRYKEAEVQSAPVAPNNINITLCEQRIKRNFHPLNNCAGLKRNIWKLLERGHQGESKPSRIKKNVNFILLNRPLL